VVTELGIIQIGNAAHLAGLVFGVLVAEVCIRRQRFVSAVCGLTLMFSLSVMVLVWCPWSVTWLGIRAYDAHAAENYPLAIREYTRILEINPQNAWALINRSYAHLGLNDIDAADADRQAALIIDPLIEQ